MPGIFWAGLTGWFLLGPLASAIAILSAESGRLQIVAAVLLVLALMSAALAVLGIIQKADADANKQEEGND